MVISHILGGIGNQMFQYAAGRALAVHSGQPHRIDLSSFSSYQLHNGYELSRVFNLKTEAAEPILIRDLLGWRAHQFAMRLLRRPQMAGFRGSRLIVEPHFNFWPEFFKLKGDCYLFGYWQSDRYFKFIENVIRDDFVFRVPLEGENAELGLGLRDSRIQSVSLHVRRGDYLSDAKTSHIMNVCDPAYYYRAIQYIADRLESPVFYIFSDDIAWVKENIRIEYPCVYIDHNHGTESYRDMQLMSMCQHHIVANSSFSWWGAWLNKNTKKIVVSPKNWFRNGMNDADLIPENWQRL